MKRCATGLAMLTFATVSLLVYAGSVPSLDAAPGDDSPLVDTELAEITTHPHSYRFTDQATDRVDGRETVKIHSTVPLENNDKYVERRPGSIRYFRTDGATSSDGERASIIWSINGEFKTTDIGRPGGVIMVVRSLDGVVSWYSLQIDLRC
jgi:hypothetical protein